MNTKKIRILLWAGLVICTILFTACQPSTGTDLPVEPVDEEITEEQTPETEEIAVEATEVSATEATESGPQTGGRFMWAVSQEPETLDPHKTGTKIAGDILGLIGATLVYLKSDGTLSPYLAESWEISEDGLTYTFHLRQDVKFHDGSPLTAQDFAWTFNRAINPETASPVAGQMLYGVQSVEATDTYTLQINMSQPYFSLLIGLSTSYLQPLPQAIIEAQGEDEFFKHPIGVGPYQFVSYMTGERIELERNPDFVWAPIAMVEEGRDTYYIDQIEVRFIYDTATIAAGLESGEIDYAAIDIPNKTILEATGNFIFYNSYNHGAKAYISLNNAVPPFDNILVRQAFSYAIDRDAIIHVVLQDAGIPQYGPISPATIGYWSGVEEIGYKFDLERAKELMQEAGYTYADDGMLLTPEGEPFTLSINTSESDLWVRMATMIQGLLKDLGVDLQVVQMESSQVFGKNLAGDYQISLDGYDHFDADILFFFFHSQGMNTMHINDPALDAAMQNSRSAIDPETRQEFLNEIQRIIVENAYQIPIASHINFSALNNQVQGATFNEKMVRIELIGAYFME